MRELPLSKLRVDIALAVPCRRARIGDLARRWDRVAGRIGNCLHERQVAQCSLFDLARHQDLSPRRVGIDDRWRRHHRSAPPLVIPTECAGRREKPEGRAVLCSVFPAVPEPGRTDGAAVRDPRADFHGFRVHRAHDLRAQRVAPGTAAAAERAGAMG